jgi:hypothetical protein
MGGAEPPGATRSAPFACEYGEDGEHRTFLEVSAAANSNRSADKANIIPLRSVTSRNVDRHKCGSGFDVDRSALWSMAGGAVHAKHQFVRLLAPPLFQPTLQRLQLSVREGAGLLLL